MSEIIKTQELEYAYYDENNLPHQALRGVDLTFEEGDFVAVLGHNGSGKSTLAGHFNGIRLPSGGTVWVDGIDTKIEEKLYDVRRTCAMVFQNPDNQIVATVVEEDVAFALENLGVPPAEIRQRVDEALKAVGMYEFRRHAPHKLSGGQKQRIAIAGVIAIRPRCIVFDEPTAMLDPAGRREVMRVIGRLTRELGTTVILITHHMDEAVQANRVVVMSGGRVMLDGTPREIFSQVGLLRRLRLTVPQTIEVLHDLNDTGADLPIAALSVEECADILTRYLQ